jgi:hypothetical protein
MQLPDSAQQLIMIHGMGSQLYGVSGFGRDRAAVVKSLLRVLRPTIMHASTAAWVT